MISTIVTHERPHLDEIAAIWLFCKFGEEKFPGIGTAKIVFWSTGGQTPDGRSAEDYEQEGILLVGIGGGRFDEHPTVNSERKEGECAVTLVARALGVDDDPALENILRYVASEDFKARAQPFDLAYLVKLLHQRYPDNPEKVMEWAMVGLEAKYHEQFGFFNNVKQEFERAAEVEEIEGPGGRKIKMVTIVSDDEQINKFSRSAHGCRAAIVIQKQSSGNVQIFTNKRFGLTLYDVAQMIRLAEQQAKGQLVTTEWKVLSSEGKVKGAEEWYFHHQGQMLLNGSLTAKGVPSTRLSLEQIKEIVRIGVNPVVFEPSRAPDCKRGVCISMRQNPCGWYHWGLHRCQEIRYEMRNPNHFLNSR